MVINFVIYVAALVQVHKFVDFFEVCCTDVFIAHKTTSIRIICRVINIVLDLLIKSLSAYTKKNRYVNLSHEDNEFKFSNFDFQNKRQYHEDNKINSFAKLLLPDKECKHGGVFEVELAFFLLLLVSIG